MVAAVALRWEEPDHGIWEVRDFRRHWVYSKVMCWHAVNRAIAVADIMQAESRHDWIDLRQRIADDVLSKGFCERKGVFTSAYAHDDLDAAVLQIGLLGLVEPTDPRFVATVEAIEKELVVNGHVMRYLLDDQLPGLEGAFNICTAWLAEALARMGRVSDAEKYFATLADCAGKTGLLSEQVDPRTSDSMGNFPQAYSHLGLINAAVAIQKARNTPATRP
jgi:GH15 family glucan-1,4-alpha-glucosidase